MTPSTSEPSPHPSMSGHRQPGSNFLPGRWRAALEQVAEYLRPFGAAGVGQVQVRFPTGSREELCDQIAAFGETVIPLVAD